MLTQQNCECKNQTWAQTMCVVTALAKQCHVNYWCYSVNKDTTNQLAAVKLMLEGQQVFSRGHFDRINQFHLCVVALCCTDCSHLRFSASLNKYHLSSFVGFGSFRQSGECEGINGAPVRTRSLCFRRKKEKQKHKSGQIKKISMTQQEVKCYANKDKLCIWMRKKHN